MVDVGDKPVTVREAAAESFLPLPEALRARVDAEGPKGHPLRTAELAGIQAAKRTFELIPLCHPLPLDRVEVRCEVAEGGVRIRSRCGVHARTGVEMEALTAASVAALTLYDMLKAEARDLEIGPTRLLWKKGGASGEWRSSSDR